MHIRRMCCGLCCDMFVSFSFTHQNSDSFDGNSMRVIERNLAVVGRRCGKLYLSKNAHTNQLERHTVILYAKQ